MAERDPLITAVDHEIAQLHAMRLRVCANFLPSPARMTLLAEITKCKAALVSMKNGDPDTRVQDPEVDPLGITLAIPARDQFTTTAEVDEDISKLHGMRRRVWESVCRTTGGTPEQAMVLREITKCEDALIAKRESLLKDAAEEEVKAPDATPAAIDMHRLKQVTSVPDPGLEQPNESYRRGLFTDNFSENVYMLSQIRGDLVWVNAAVGNVKLEELLSVTEYSAEIDACLLRTYNRNFSSLQQLYACVLTTRTPP